jgi:hypothetical protein
VPGQQHVGVGQHQDPGDRRTGLDHLAGQVTGPPVASRQDRGPVSNQLNPVLRVAAAASVQNAPVTPHPASAVSTPTARPHRSGHVRRAERDESAVAEQRALEGARQGERHERDRQRDDRLRAVQVQHELAGEATATPTTSRPIPTSPDRRRERPSL